MFQSTLVFRRMETSAVSGWTNSIGLDRQDCLQTGNTKAGKGSYCPSECYHFLTKEKKGQKTVGYSTVKQYNKANHSLTSILLLTSTSTFFRAFTFGACYTLVDWNFVRCKLSQSGSLAFGRFVGIKKSLVAGCRIRTLLAPCDCCRQRSVTFCPARIQRYTPDMNDIIVW